MINSRLINTKVAGGGGCTDIVDNYDPFGGNGVALYQLNGNANDVSGNYNGTATNVTYGTGVFGQAGVFNGSSSYIKAPNPLYTGSPLTDYTVSAWFKINAYGDQYPTIFAGQTGGTSLPPYLWVSASILRLHGYTYNDYTNTLSTGVWYNAVMVNSGTTTELYLNGSLQTPTSRNTYTTTTGEFFVLGAIEGYPTTTSFDGSIDQLRFFNTALTPLEVEALYTEELCICDGTVDTLDILRDGSCIATYQLDGNANDLSGNYSGQATNVSYGVGEFDLAGVFNGSSSYVNIGDPAALRLLGSYSISFWIKFNSTSGLQRIINKDNANDYSGGYAIYTNGTSFEMVHSNGSYNGLAVANAFTTGVWYNFAVTFNSSNNSLKAYKNGIEVASTTTSGSLTNSGDNLFFGTFGQSSPISQWLNGSLDQVRIFNKALNLTEVTKLYNETACSTSENPEPVLYLSAYDSASYSGSGSTWFDISGNNYNGSIGAGVSWTGSAFSFNDSSNSIVTNYDSVITGNAQRSMEMYAAFNETVGGGVVAGLGNMGNGSLGSSWSFTPLESTDGSALLGGGGAYDEVFTTNITRISSSFQHIVVTWDALDRGTLKLYVNGTLAETIVRSTGESYTTVNGYTLGWWGLQNGYWKFNGNIKLVRMYDIALDGSQVASAYSEVISL
jgi:hypothetical protein